MIADGGLAGLIQAGNIESEEQLLEGKDESVWALIAKDRASFALLEHDGRWTSLPSQPGRTPYPRYVWTDDYSSMFTVASRW